MTIGRPNNPISHVLSEHQIRSMIGWLKTHVKFPQFELVLSNEERLSKHAQEGLRRETNFLDGMRNTVLGRLVLWQSTDGEIIPRGSVWNKSPQSDRQWYVVGFMQGYVLGKRDMDAMFTAKLEKGELSNLKFPSMTPAEKEDMDEGIGGK